MKYKRILITGSVGYDVIMDFPSRFIDQIRPDKLHQLNVSFVVDRLHKQIGGIATNIAYNLSIISDIPVVVLAGVGKDGQDVLNFYRRNNIDIQNIVVDKKLYCSNGIVITDTKDNQIWGYYYGATIGAKKIKLTDELVKNSIITISAGHPEAMLSFQRQSIKKNVTYLYDPGMSLSWISNKQLLDGITHCRWLVGNDYEIAQFISRLGLSLNDIIQKGVEVITTLGEKGVEYRSLHNTYEVPGYNVSRVVDPTGAGDAWRAGFLAGVIEEKSIKESLAMGNALASFAVESYGTVQHRPTKKQVMKRANTLLK